MKAKKQLPDPKVSLRIGFFFSLKRAGEKESDGFHLGFGSQEFVLIPGRRALQVKLFTKD